MSTQTERINIPENVRHLRRVQGLIQVGLAESLGLCQSWISRLERRAENPSIEIPQRLPTGLRVQLQDLFDGTGAETPAP